MNAHFTVKRLLTPLLGLLIYVSAGVNVRADDIDIYLNPTVTPTAVPVVMFTSCARCHVHFGLPVESRGNRLQWWDV